MKILVCIPALYGAEILKECLTNLVGRTDVDILVLDNGADNSVKNIIHNYLYNYGIKVWRNTKNEYVNRPWNEFLSYFLDMPEYDYLCIINSDLLLQKNWADVLCNRWRENPDEIILPIISDDKELMNKKVTLYPVNATVAQSGTPGVFITLNRVQAKLVHPIPYDVVKIWFGDNWIFEICRAQGYKTVIPENFLAFHHWSATLQLLPDRDQLLEEDKKMWHEVGQKKLADKIESLKQKQS